MKAFRLRIGMTAALAIGLFSIPAAAHADTYQLLVLASGNNFDLTDIVGITASGTAVLVYHVPAGAPLCSVSGICQEYQTWADGHSGILSPEAPDYVYDNGTPCTVDAPFLAYAVPGTCNNGHEVYNAGLAAAIPYTDATFIGPDPATDMLANGESLISQVDLNASGDILFSETHHAAGGTGEFVEAIDLTTSQVPEPASIFLMSTGLLAAAEMARRRLQPKAK